MPTPPPSSAATARAPWVASAIALGVFLLLAAQLVLGGALTTRLDPAVTAWLAARRTPLATGLLRALTTLHSTLGIDLMLAAIAAAIGLGLRRWRDALWLVLTVQGAMVLNFVLKNSFARPRPALDVPLVHLSSFSFPSGHAVSSTALWAAVVLLLPPGWRRAGGVLAAATVGLVAFSRVYLGAHYLCDVLAGIAVGTFCVGVAQALRLRPSRRGMLR